MAFGGRLERALCVQVGADGSPPVIHRARVMAREASGRASVNLGGIAEASAFVPWMGWKRFFVFQTGRRHRPLHQPPEQIKCPNGQINGGKYHEKEHFEETPVPDRGCGPGPVSHRLRRREQHGEYKHWFRQRDRLRRCCRSSELPPGRAR